MAPAPAIAVRPLSIGELLDGGYRTLRSYPRVVLGTAAVFLVPLSLVVAVIGEGRVNPGLVTRGSAAAGVVGVAGYSLATSLMGLPLARATLAMAAGRAPTLRDSFRLPWRTWLAAPVSWAMVGALKVAGSVLLVLPMVAVVALSVPLSPVLAIERLGPFAALARAWGLSARTLGRTVALVCANALTTLTVGAALIVPISLVAGAPDGPRRPFATLLQLAVALIVTPTAAVTAALCYLDQRVRTEAVDLREQLAKLGGPHGR